MHNKLTYNLALITLTVFLSGCYDNYVSSIPNAAVRLQLNLTSTYPTFKDNPNSYLVFDKPVQATDRVGYGGVLVYVGFDGNYYAFDLACPYEAKQNIKVTPNDLGQVVCETCGTVYDISYGVGNPTEGPSKETLKRYKTSLEGDWLHVFN
jgi:nitrite reductase/ring-hydroxylating ferredoxin subunit